MATPYNITDTGLQTPVNTTDYGFLNTMLMRSNQQEEQGIQKVGSDYSSILSSPVTGDAATERKQQYVKQVQEGLKKVSTMDLSLPQNVAQAENLYAPFWKDQNLVANIGLTKYYQNETSKLDSWEGSTDKSIRDQYNAYSRQDVQNGLRQLARAPLDVNAYNKLQRRTATPFYNIDADVDEAWQKEQGVGKGIDTVYSTGEGAMFTEHNGIKSKDAYKTYYLSKMASGKYDAQIKVMARVQNENAKDEILRNNPQLTEQQVNQQFAQEQMDRLGSSTKSIAGSYDAQVQFWQQKAKDIEDQVRNRQKGIVSSEQKDSWLGYVDKIKAYKEQADRFNQLYWNQYSPVTINNDPNTQYSRTLQDLAEHPDDHIAHLQKDNMAESWAAGRASISSEKKELDPLWAKYQDLAIQKDQIAVEREKTAATLRGQTLGYEEATGRTLRGEQLPGFNPVSEHGWYGKGYGLGVTGLPAGHMTGEHTIEPGHIPTSVIEQSLHNKEMAATDNYLNPDRGGISNIVLSQLGVSQNDIIDFTEGVKTALNGNTPSAGQSAAYKKVQDLLVAHGVNLKGVIGPRTMITALSTYAADVAKQLRGSDKEDDKSLAISLAGAISTTNTMRDSYITSQKNYDEALKSELLSNPKYKTIINPATGKDYTAHDMAADIPSVTIRTVSGAMKTLSPVEVAEIRRKGTSIQDIGNIQMINGQPVGKYHDRDGFEHITYAGGLLDNLEKHLTGKYGTPEQNAQLRTEAMDNVVPKLKEFKNGIVAKEINYDPNSDNEQEAQFVHRLGPELALPSNTEGKLYSYEPGTNTRQELSAKQEEVARATLSNISDMKAHIGAIGKTLNDNGEEVYVVHFKQPTNASESDPRFELAGKTVYMKESSNAQGPIMNLIPHNSGMYIYGDIAEGKTLHEDPVFKAMGLTYQWKGYAINSVGKATKSALTINQRLPDPQDISRTIDVPVVQITIPHSGPEAKTYDEVGEAIKKFSSNFLTQWQQNSYNAHRNITQGTHISELQNSQ